MVGWTGQSPNPGGRTCCAAKVDAAADCAAQRTDCYRCRTVATNLRIGCTTLVGAAWRERQDVVEWGVVVVLVGLSGRRDVGVSHSLGRMVPC